MTFLSRQPATRRLSLVRSCSVLRYVFAILLLRYPRLRGASRYLLARNLAPCNLARPQRLKSDKNRLVRLVGGRAKAAGRLLAIAFLALAPTPYWLGAVCRQPLALKRR